jgi:hypothetical protein
MLPRLNPDPQVTVDVQQTAFSHDVLGRWCCATWNEVSNNGGDPFDVVVIGAGMFGGYIAEKLDRHAANIGLRVLVVEAAMFVADACSEPAAHRLGAPTEQIVAVNAQDPGTKSRRGILAQQPGISGLAYCLGRVSLFRWSLG